MVLLMWALGGEDSEILAEIEWSSSGHLGVLGARKITGNWVPKNGRAAFSG